MIVKIIKDIRKRMETQIKKEIFNKDLEDVKSKQTKMNSTISEMKNTRRNPWQDTGGRRSGTRQGCPLFFFFPKDVHSCHFYSTSFWKFWLWQS